jgi:hypothetical protein
MYKSLNDVQGFRHSLRLSHIYTADGRSRPCRDLIYELSSYLALNISGNGRPHPNEQIRVFDSTRTTHYCLLTFYTRDIWPTKRLRDT